MAEMNIEAMYKIKRKELQNEVVASAQQLRIKPQTMESVLKKIDVEPRQRSNSP
jgi:hypothetical protein